MHKPASCGTGDVVWTNANFGGYTILQKGTGGQILTTKSLTAPIVQRVLEAATTAATQCGAKICVAVVDRGGALAGFVRMPGSFLVSAELASDKAWTAIGFGMSTAEFGILLTTLPADVRDGLKCRPRVTAVPGGLCVPDCAGIGISGGSAEEDELIAGKALAVLQEGLA